MPALRTELARLVFTLWADTRRQEMAARKNECHHFGFCAHTAAPVKEEVSL